MYFYAVQSERGGGGEAEGCFKIRFVAPRSMAWDFCLVNFFTHYYLYIKVPFCQAKSSVVFSLCFSWFHMLENPRTDPNFRVDNAVSAF